MIIRNKEYDEEFCKKIISMYSEYNSCQKVWKELQIPQYVVEFILKNEGIEINQSKKRELRRNKTCANCNKEYYDETKRSVGIVCSKQCQYELVTKKRQEKNSYTGRILSKEEKDFLSKVNKEIWSNDDLKQERLNHNKQISVEKYGVEHWTRSEIVKEKYKQTNIEKYGVPHPVQNQEIVDKIQSTRNERGINKIYDGKNMHQWSEEIGVSYTYFKQVVNQRGFEEARKLSQNQTNIEAVMSGMLKNFNIHFTYNNFISNDKIMQFRPDFILDEQRLIIECDGLFWHSDRIKKNNSYHKRKQDYFFNLGYETVFFRSDEILTKAHIVQSILQNKLKKNKIIYARKLFISVDEDDLFLENNHLMGPGCGRKFFLQQQDGTKLACLQVKWKSVQNRILEISRFCTKNGHSVVGGYSKLIKYAINTENPKSVTTFVDKRYGNGAYLERFGFVKKSESLSFAWTNGIRTFHRMKFPGNSGYQKNLAKIWDCGQIRWDMEVIEI